MLLILYILSFHMLQFFKKTSFSLHWILLEWNFVLKFQIYILKFLSLQFFLENPWSLRDWFMHVFIYVFYQLFRVLIFKIYTFKLMFLKRKNFPFWIIVLYIISLYSLPLFLPPSHSSIPPFRNMYWMLTTYQVLLRRHVG